jgi:hypothetical protein
MHRIREDIQPRTPICKNIHGVILGEENGTLGIWVEDFKKILNTLGNGIINGIFWTTA